MNEIKIVILPCEEHPCQCLSCINSDCASKRCQNCDGVLMNCTDWSEVGVANVRNSVG